MKAYVKRGKSDALDAETICEVVQRPTMRFVPVKTVEQQCILMTYRAELEAERPGDGSDEEPTGGKAK